MCIVHATQENEFLILTEKFKKKMNIVITTCRYYITSATTSLKTFTTCGGDKVIQIGSTRRYYEYMVLSHANMYSL